MERKSFWPQMWMRRGVLVQDRDGRVRRMLVLGRPPLRARLHAMLLGITVVERLPMY